MGHCRTLATGSSAELDSPGGFFAFCVGGAPQQAVETGLRAPPGCSPERSRVHCLTWGTGTSFIGAPFPSRWGSCPSGTALLRNNSTAGFRKHGFCGQGASEPAGGAPAPRTGGGSRPREPSAVLRLLGPQRKGWSRPLQAQLSPPERPAGCSGDHGARAQPCPTTLAPATGRLQVPDAGCRLGFRA